MQLSPEAPPSLVSLGDKPLRPGPLRSELPLSDPSAPLRSRRLRPPALCLSLGGYCGGAALRRLRSGRSGNLSKLEGVSQLRSPSLPVSPLPFSVARPPTRPPDPSDLLRHVDQDSRTRRNSQFQ